MPAKTYAIPSKKRFRALKQYSPEVMTDEEFEEFWAKKIAGMEASKDFESRIKSKIEEFSDDYDLDDLKANDKLVLRALAQAYITLEDYEIYSFNLRTEGGIGNINIVELEKTNNIMSSLRRDISNMQTDLKITRKIRKGEKEESVINTIEDLQQKAKEFYRNKMFYVWCDECQMLLFTGWFLYPETNKNKINLVCQRPLQDGGVCGNVVKVDSKFLLENRGINISEVPEFFK
jgi:hypothetical protein